MEVKTKYKPGEHIIIIGYNEISRQVEIYEDYIDCVCIEKNSYFYITKNCIELGEDEIILYKDQDRVRNEIYYLLEKNSSQKINK